MGYTPGPWKRWTGEGQAPSLTVISTSRMSDRTICLCEAGTLEAQANADAIAALPELLEASILALRWIEAMGNPQASSYGVTTRQLREAIGKVLGEDAGDRI